MSTVETSTMREELRMLVDHLPESDVATARKILRALMDPVELSLLTAPPDDETLSEHEMAALEEADRREQRGEALIPHEDILREFGLSEPAAQHAAVP
jgi:hypothetical protein